MTQITIQFIINNTRQCTFGQKIQPLTNMSLGSIYLDVDK